MEMLDESEGMWMECYKKHGYVGVGRGLYAVECRARHLGA